MKLLFILCYIILYISLYILSNIILADTHTQSHMMLYRVNKMYISMRCDIIFICTCRHCISRRRRIFHAWRSSNIFIYIQYDTYIRSQVWAVCAISQIGAILDWALHTHTYIHSVSFVCHDNSNNNCNYLFKGCTSFLSFFAFNMAERVGYGKCLTYTYCCINISLIMIIFEHVIIFRQFSLGIQCEYIYI